MTKDEERLSRLRLIVAALPSQPGCYQYLDETGKIIYVGKAKNLKNRVSSYFHKTVDRRKTEILVSKIHDIKYVVVSSDMDALLLENNLIKKYKPHYNILLKDGKTYPSVCVTKEYLPRVFKTRNRQKRGATYYGPFSHIGTLNNILELIKKMYSLRRCNTPMSKEGVAAGKYKPCLEYHLKNCKAPCVARQTHDEYMRDVADVKEISIISLPLISNPSMLGFLWNRSTSSFLT